jgi:ATP-binding cassette, subfamily B (MDR/TAP), member 1
MLKAVLRQDLRFFDRTENSVGAIVSRIETNAQSVFELMGFNIALILSALFTAVAASIMAIAVSWKVGLVGVFAGLPPIVLAGYVRIRVETKLDDDINEKFSSSTSIACEAIGAMRTIASLALEHDVLRRYTALLDLGIREASAPLFTSMIFFSMTQSAEFLVLALGFWSVESLNGHFSPPKCMWLTSGSGGDPSSSQKNKSVSTNSSSPSWVFTFQAKCARKCSATQPVRSYLPWSHVSHPNTGVQGYTQALSAARYFFWLLDLSPTISETDRNQHHDLKDGCKSYDFSDVTFAYPLIPDKQVLKNVTLQVCD